eukprot:1155922-Pelagomonas_calceolata.AAC.4
MWEHAHAALSAAAGALNGHTLQSQGGRICALLTRAIEEHAAERERSRDEEAAAGKEQKGGFPSLHAWLGPSLLAACDAAAAAARTLCNDLPSALQEPGAKYHLRKLQDRLACMKEAWHNLGALDRAELEVRQGELTRRQHWEITMT